MQQALCPEACNTLQQSFDDGALFAESCNLSELGYGCE